MQRSLQMILLCSIDHGVAVRCEGERKMSEHVDPVFGNESTFLGI